MQKAAQSKPKRKTEKDIEIEQGGPGIYNIDLRKNYFLENPDWKNDVIPEFMDGMNVADFVDDDIERKLLQLEKEEAKELQEYTEQQEMDDGHDDVAEDEKELAAWIKSKRALLKLENALRKTNNKPKTPRKFKTQNVEQAEKNLMELGLDPQKFRSTSVARSQSKARKKRRRADGDPMEDKENDQDINPAKSLRSRSRMASRSKSRTRTPSEMGFANEKSQQKAAKLAKKGQKNMNRNARVGEADRRQYNYMPKHLFSGKRGIGKTDRR